MIRGIEPLVQDTEPEQPDSSSVIQSRGAVRNRSGVTAPTKECGRVEINRTNTAIEMAHQYAKEHAKEEVKLPNRCCQF